jgi:hypothetical protein
MSFEAPPPEKLTMFTNAAIRFAKAVAAQACANYPVLSDPCADEIEQRLIRAYVQLVFQPADTDSSRSIFVMRLGPLEVRLTELHLADTSLGLAPFWIEVFDWSHQASVDSIGVHEFDDDETAAAVEMIVSAAHDAGTRNVSPPN